MPAQKRSKEGSRLEIELEMLRAELSEQREQSHRLTQLIGEEDKKISQLNNKIETLLQEQKYEIIELAQVLNNFRRKTENNVVLTNKEYDDMIRKIEALQHEIEDLRNKKESSIEEKSSQIEELRSQLQDFKGIMLKQSQFIGQYRGSIMFPLYRLSSSFGKTGIGQLIQKIIK
ncbi:hypothetical protein JXC34_01710 [Candidatus Woesearchaeota archaeon]|nr:hypothetical protein [Candidatus Woesearchaeota archaeon]